MSRRFRERDWAKLLADTGAVGKEALNVGKSWKSIRRREQKPKESLIQKKDTFRNDSAWNSY